MKNVIYFVLVLFLFELNASETEMNATDEMMIINSGLADYDGKKITLSDNVVVKHELGTISANHIVFLPVSNTKPSFALLQLNDNVIISLTEGGQLSCSKADIDYQKLTGTFLGGSQREYVVYTENCRGEEGNISLILKSRKLEIQIKRDEENNQAPKSLVSRIVADSNVTINYDHNFIAVADYAIYQRLEPLESDFSFALPGIITLQASPQRGICRVTNREGDMIKANQISIDTNKQELAFSNPKGAINLAHITKKSGRVDFSAGNLLWDQINGKLTLKDNVVVSQNGMGKLKTDHEVYLIQEVIDGRKQLSFIESLSDTTLIYTHLDKNLEYTLNCYGGLCVDHKKLEANLKSPKDDNGKYLKNKQVLFQDNRGEIFADELQIIYGMENQTIYPEKIILTGNVRVLNYLSPSNEKTSSVLQYALADTIEYFPRTEEMLFKANENRRVLFYDKANNLEVSAPALKLKRDIDTKKQSIQGLGDVRFSFIEKEFQQMRKRFSFDK